MRECGRILYIPRDFLRSHAATAVKSDERERLERLVRYMARPAIAEDRISVLSNGDIKLKLKTPWRDGSEFLLFTPTEFLEKLLALVPLPKFHLTRYYGVFAPASPHRKNLPDRPQSKTDDNEERNDASSDVPHKSKLAGGKKSGKRRAGWAALLKRSFNIDVLQCPQCSGRTTGTSSGRMKLVEVVMSGERIRDTLVAIGVSPRPPPIAPARTPGLFGFEEFVDTESCWPDDNESEATAW